MKKSEEKKKKQFIRGINNKWWIILFSLIVFGIFVKVVQGIDLPPFI